MSKVDQKSYRRVVKDLSKKEIAESILISKADHEDFLRKRLELLNSRTKDEVTVSNLLQLKYELETYLELGEYDPKYNFSVCLRRYMQIISKTSKDLTEDLTIHKTRLSRILNDREEANSILAYKLEKHSNLLIPAILWWKLVTLRKEFEIRTNKKERSEAGKKVKNIINLPSQASR